MEHIHIKETFMKEKSFRMRIDDDFEKKFSAIAGENKSAFIRQTIEIMSSKEFRESINLNNMEKMEELSLQCRKILNENDGFLKVSTVSEKFPAFICNKKDRGAFIYVKCPTFTVCILKQMDRQEIESLNAMLNLTVSSELVATKRVWWNDEGQEEPFLYETACFGKNLEENKKIKDDVEWMFKNAGYRTETGVSYYILKKPIGIVNIEGEEYFALLDKFDI